MDQLHEDAKYVITVKADMPMIELYDAMEVIVSPAHWGIVSVLTTYRIVQLINEFYGYIKLTDRMKGVTCTYTCDTRGIHHIPGSVQVVIQVTYDKRPDIEPETYASGDKVN